MKKLISALFLGSLLVAPVSQTQTADISDILKIGSGVAVGFAAGVFGLYYYLKQTKNEPKERINIQTRFVRSPEQTKADQLQQVLQEDVTTAHLTVSNPAHSSVIIALFNDLGFQQANTYEPDPSKLLFVKQTQSVEQQHVDSEYSDLFTSFTNQ